MIVEAKHLHLPQENMATLAGLTLKQNNDTLYRRKRSGSH